MDNAVDNRSLEILLSGDENESKEFKSASVLREPNDRNKRKIAEQLISFANSGGGKVIFGVDDNNEVEGKSLDEEKSLGTISQIARMRCQPPVSFSYEFFSESSGDLDEGEVFLLEIDARKSIPHAIVDNSGGEIRKREYRLRSGDESRLITDNELKWLFENSIDDLNVNSSYEGWLLFDERSSYIGSPKRLGPEPPNYGGKSKIPVGSRYILNYLDMIEFEELEDELDFVFSENKAIFMAPLIVDLVPFAFQISLIDNFSDGGSTSGDFGNLKMEETNFSEISIEGEGVYLPNFDIDPLEATQKILERPESSKLRLPEGCEVKIELAEDSFELGAIGPAESKIIFKKEDRFLIEIVVSFITAGETYPANHPEEYRRINQEKDSYGSSVEFSMDFSANFDFPRNRDEYIQEHQTFANKIKEIINSEWDSKEWVSEKQDNMIFDINAKLERLFDELQAERNQNAEHEN